jgi:hypothetical protein
MTSKPMLTGRIKISLTLPSERLDRLAYSYAADAYRSINATSV